MTLSDLLNKSTCWDDIYQKLKQLNTSESDRSKKNTLAGKLFEEFCKYYYLTEPSIQSEYKNVWLFREVPQKVKSKLGFKAIDHGVDIVLEDNMGMLSVVQCKFKNDQSSAVFWSKDKLANLFAEGDKADYFIVFTNASKLDQHSLNKKEGQLKLITLGDLLQISQTTIYAMKAAIKDNIPPKSIRKTPRDYQKVAVKDVIEGFKDNDRGQLILPCGAGKTLVSLWIKEAMQPKHTLLLFPSLALLRQTKNEWSANSKNFLPYICVCSEKDIDGKSDHNKTHIYEIIGKVSTDPDEIREFLHGDNNKIVYATYQSLNAINQAIKDIDFQFDLVICDEAHKTSGNKLEAFGLIHDNANTPARKRLYMTATPRILSEQAKSKISEDKVKYICDMSDPNIFGLEFHRMGFKEAIEQGILVDYKIVAMGIDNVELANAARERQYAGETTVDEIVHNYALEKFMKKHDAHHAITFHSTVKKAEAFEKRHLDLYSEAGTDTYHVNGNLTTNNRNIIMSEFKNSEKGVVTNSRCLTEGVDVPVIDAVYFCDPKYSKVDIVQAAGRALRKADGKKLGYIVVPIFHNKKDNLEDVIENHAFKNLVNVVRALSSHDERLVDEITRIKLGQGPEKARPAERLVFDSTLKFIALEGFEDSLEKAIYCEIIDKIRGPWRKFQEARSYIHTLNLKSIAEWRRYSKSCEKPQDIPATPDQVYKNKGWVSYGDWLGTDTIATQKRIYKEFAEAKKYIHTLQLKGASEWRKYSKNGKKPNDIPADPKTVYKEDGWVSWGDWLGTDTIATQKRIYKEFAEAKKYIHTLQLKGTSEWSKYSKNGKKPNDIPADPKTVYKNKGWVGWGDWLGTGRANRVRQCRPFAEARNYIHTLNIKTMAEWREYSKSGKKPDDIPADPPSVYKDKGWVSWCDWLGRIAKVYRSFTEARNYIHTLNLKNRDGWREYSKSGKKPDDIPVAPDQVYKDRGWVSWGDWLGTSRISNRERLWRPFAEARNYMHALNLKNIAEWREYSKSGKKPNDIPSNPNNAYKDKGWVSYGDWLGTGRISNRERSYRPFAEARNYIHTLNLKGEAEWRKYLKSGRRPDDIPSKPEEIYKDDGWISWGDWLGTGRIANSKRVYRSFTEARNYIHTLHFKGADEWREYSKSGKKPNDIPSNPNNTYKDKGWISWGDWLGTGRVSNSERSYRSFAEARNYIHALNIESMAEWREYSKSGERPSDIPAAPRRVYKDKGWLSWGDWFGTGTIATQKRMYREFVEARNYIHTLNIKSIAEWIEYSKRGVKPYDIPADPRRVYKDRGWVSWGDWLGTGTIAPQKRMYREFVEARNYIHSLNLKSVAEWREYSKSGKRPDDIPADPAMVYKNKGWVSYGDWLGTGSVPSKSPQ